MFLFLPLILFSLRTSSNFLSIFLNVFLSRYLRLNSYIENTLSSVLLMGYLFSFDGIKDMGFGVMRCTIALFPFYLLKGEFFY